MRQIAAEVGVQAGALYLYTPDKQSLLFDILREHMDHLLQTWDNEPRPVDPCGQLDAFARFHVLYHLDRPETVFIAYMELRSLEPTNFAVIEALRKRYENGLEEILDRGVRAGVFAVSDTKLATMALIAMLTGVTNWFREGGRLGRAEVAATYATMALRAVGAR
jgi:AcrR family transcriptional regulator